MNRVLQTAHLWAPGYCRSLLRKRSAAPVKRIWLQFADHFEPWWRQPSTETALDRVKRWTTLWPQIALRHRDSLGRPACYTFFYPEEQYHPKVMEALAAFRHEGIGDVEIHLHHDHDTEDQFRERMTLFAQRLHNAHGLLHQHNGRTVFGFIHGNWALDNSLPGGRFCGLNNEITLLKELGCYADFTLPSAPSAAQVSMVNTIYWATDDPARPKSHDRGTPLTPGSPISGDLLMIPGPLALNLKEWNRPLVPKLEIGELAGNALPTPHRARLWTRAAPQVGEDVFVKLFAHGAPEKNAGPLLEGGMLARTLDYMTGHANEIGAQIMFVSAWEMWKAVDAIRRGADPVDAVNNSAHVQALGN